MSINHGASVTKFLKNLHGVEPLNSEGWSDRDAVLDLFSGLVYAPHPLHPLADKIAVHSAIGGESSVSTGLVVEMLFWRQAQFMVLSGECRDARKYEQELRQWFYEQTKVNLF